MKTLEAFGIICLFLLSGGTAYFILKNFFHFNFTGETPLWFGLLGLALSVLIFAVYLFICIKTFQYFK